MIIKNITQRGFSLIEVAVALVIIGLIIGSFTGLYELILNTDREKRERVSIHKIHKSLNTFMAANMHLPCPDSDNDGHENRDADKSCTGREGYLPYKDIGVDALDAWGNYYYYRVNQQTENLSDITNICSSASVMGNGGTKSLGTLKLCPDTNIYYCNVGGCSSACSPTSCIDVEPRSADEVPPYFHLATPPFGSEPGSDNLKIYSESASPFDNTNGRAYGGDDGNGTVAVVISWGANGNQTFRYTSSSSSCTAGSSAELENCDNDRVFADTKTGENRDYLTWITVNQAKMALIYNGEFR